MRRSSRTVAHHEVVAALQKLLIVRSSLTSECRNRGGGDRGRARPRAVGRVEERSGGLKGDSTVQVKRSQMKKIVLMPGSRMVKLIGRPKNAVFYGVFADG